MRSYPTNRSGFTWVEMLVLLVVMGGLIGLIVLGLQAYREASRRTQCTENMRQLGVMVQTFVSRKKTFPTSNKIRRSETGEIVSEDGWSWIHQSLPEMEGKAVYELFDMRTESPSDTSHPGVKQVLDTAIGDLICPSYGGPRYADPAAKSGGITNYKAMGATHWESLSVNTTTPETPKYLDTLKGVLPDGALCPGRNHKPEDFTDGLGNTILVAETTEPVFARWAVGSEATLVGLPPEITFALTDGAESYYAPAGFDGAFGDDSELDSTWKPYVGYDDSETGDGAYLPDKNQGTRGPGSNHNGTVNHLFADGDVRSIRTDVDAAMYMFLITRDGGDPTDEFFGD